MTFLGMLHDWDTRMFVAVATPPGQNQHDQLGLWMQDEDMTQLGKIHDRDTRMCVAGATPPETERSG